MTMAKRTPFYQIQAERGARFIDFGGWELPVQYKGLIAEHQAVRQRVGLFDVSHMGEIVVDGPEATAALQLIVTNDAAKLVPGKALYTVMCREDGGIVDDLIVYRESSDRYFLCVNASRRDEDWQHIAAEAARFDCTVSDVSDDYAQLALQGPRAKAIMEELCTPEVAGLGSFAWADARVADIEGVRVARTGYTGEHGYELYCRSDLGPALWRAIEAVGAKHELALCGLGARDTLRLEAKLPLYGNDISLEHNPLEAGLGWVVKWQKGEFIGRSALAELKEHGLRRAWVGFKMKERGIPRHGYPIVRPGSDERIGEVTSGTHSPTLGEPIGLGYVPSELSAVATEIAVEIRGKPVLAEIVPTPFYKSEA